VRGSEVFGRPGAARGDIREDYPAEAGTFAGREFAREGASNCQHRTIVVRKITCSGIPVGGEKAREILLGDPHEVAQAVGAQRTVIDPPTYGSDRHRAVLSDLFYGQKGAGRTGCDS
jgi:hypothetical protein